MTKKSYGLTDEEKRRKYESDKRDYEKLPWHLPMNAWERTDIQIRNSYNRRKSTQEEWLEENK